MITDLDCADAYQRDSRPTEHLIGLAVTKDADADGDDYWLPVKILQHRLPQILDRVIELSLSRDAKARDVAATILGQNAVKNKLVTSACLDGLLGMLRVEVSPKVLSSIVFACGHLHDPRCLEKLLPLAQHSQADIRYAVVHSLCGHEDERAVKALVQLSSDDDRDVRNWATFGLGSQVAANTPEIRDALFARLREVDDEIRGEALAGLARCGDKRLINPLLKELDFHRPHTLENWVLVADAVRDLIRIATQTGETIWLPVLEKAKSLKIGDVVSVQTAIDRCKAASN